MISRKLLGAAALSLFATVASAAYPERDITGTIMWGAGGAMDVVSRAIQPHAEAVLGKKIVMVNKPGGTGAISTNFINNAPADGYNILFGAENPQLHKVLGLAEFDYDKFFPVAIFARSVGVIVVKAEGTARADVMHALAALEACQVKLMLLNQARSLAQDGYAYGYGYGYGYGN